MVDVVKRYVSEYEEDGERVLGFLKWVCRKSDDPDGAIRLIRDSLATYGRRWDWRGDVYHDAVCRNPTLLQAIAALQSE